MRTPNPWPPIGTRPVLSTPPAVPSAGELVWIEAESGRHLRSLRRPLITAGSCGLSISRRYRPKHLFDLRAHSSVTCAEAADQDALIRCMRARAWPVGLAQISVQTFLQRIDAGDLVGAARRGRARRTGSIFGNRLHQIARLPG
jgi:hypothetical protein